jgi:autotransporter-associated beta strand protein
MADTSVGSVGTVGTITGTISDGGLGRSLTKVGAGTIVLTGVNSYTGTTTVSAGVLQLGDGVTTNSWLSGPVVTRSSLVIANPFNQQIATAISGSGSVRKTGAGTLTLTGANTYTGVTTVTSGTLSIGNGGTSGSLASPIANSSVVVFNRSNSLTFAKAISGTGTLRKLGTGTLTLSGISTFSGTTEVQAGILNVTGSLKSSNIVTSGGGSLLGVEGSAKLAVGGLAAGSPYDLWATWTPASGRSAYVPYQVVDGGTVIDTVLVNQKQAPVGKVINGVPYQKLGTYVPSTGGLSVRILSQPGGTLDTGAITSEASATLPPRRFYQLAGMGFYVGETGSPITSSDVGPTFYGWMNTDSWQSAVMRGAGGTSIIAGRNGNPDLVFPFPAGCSVGYAAEFMNVRGNDLASFGVTPDQKIVVFEDWTDGDMDDDYWLVYVGEGTPTVNLDTDSNNDGDITAADDAIEEGKPGRIVPLGATSENLAEVKIDPIGLSTWVSGNITATLSASDNIRVYADAAGTQPLVEPGRTSHPWDVAKALINPLPTTVYVAGVEAGSASLTWSVSVDGYSIPDTVKFTVIDVNIDTDSDNSGHIVHAVDSPIEGNAPGRYVFVNGDDDDRNGILDVLDDHRVERENDLAPVVITDLPSDVTVSGTLIVTYNPTVARLYAGPDKNTPIDSGATVSFGATLFAEGLSPGTTLVTVTLTENRLSFSDTVRLTILPYPTPIDVDIDSDNNNDTNMPDQSEWEETLETHPYAIGKLVMLDTPQRQTVTPIVIDMPKNLPEDLPALTVRIDWDVVGRGGWVRLWNTAVVDDFRNAADAHDGGNRIFPGFDYLLSDLKYDSATGRIVIYAEGIKENETLKTLAGVESVPVVDERIRGTLLVNGDESSFDEVKYIVANDDSFYYALHTRQEVRNALASRGVYSFADMPKFSLQPKSPLDLQQLGVPDEAILDIGAGSGVAGFKSMLYQDYITGEEQYVVAFAGTDDTFGEMMNSLFTGAEGDWQNNIAQGLGFGAPAQYLAAMRIGDALANAATIPRGHVIATGHSLGGGLASAAALAGGIRGDTFNAAWLRRETLVEPDGLGGERERYAGSLDRFVAAAGSIDAYYVDYDILTAIQTLFQGLGGRISQIGAPHELDGPRDLPLTVGLVALDIALFSGAGFVGIAPSALHVLWDMYKLHENDSVLYGLLVTEGTFAPQVDMLGYSLYF